MGTRDRILEAAWALLVENQGKGVRMADIAKRAEVSRQALYLHFANRTELLVATVRHRDKVKGVDERMAASRAAKTGLARMDAFIEAWGGYVPEIYGIASALLSMKDTDEAASTAWEDRMDAVRQGCAAAIAALERDGHLAAEHDAEDATDLLWTLLSIRNWEQLTRDCGWSQEKYIATLKLLARRVLVVDGTT